MSQENVERVRVAVDHYNATGELPWDMLDREIEWVIDPAAVVAGTYRGHQGVQRLLSLLAEAFDRFSSKSTATSTRAIGYSRSAGRRSAEG